MFIPRSLLAAGLALVLVGPWAAPETRAAPADAGSFVSNLGKRAIRELTPKDISDAERVKRMRALLAEAFDVKAISKFVLGIYWRRTTEDQRAEFLKLYKTVVSHSYAGLFKKYTGETFEVIRQVSVAGGGSIVYGRIKRMNGPPVAIELQVVKKSGTYKAVDIKIEGVSMPLTHRKEYSSVIRRNRGNVAGLLSVLRKKASILEDSISE
ncbi:MAG: ABC transporter substrate-binding protein [Alphaproteobacteria bacterium]|nr:MAG: ABC transporter substrate-binding protein [Alphaproteobacteria bacterium]